MAAINPTIKAPESATKGSIPSTKAKATTSGIIAKEVVIPAVISFLIPGLLILKYCFNTKIFKAPRARF